MDEYTPMKGIASVKRHFSQCEKRFPCLLRWCLSRLFRATNTPLASLSCCQYQALLVGFESFIKSKVSKSCLVSDVLHYKLLTN